MSSEQLKHVRQVLQYYVSPLRMQDIGTPTEVSIVHRYPVDQKYKDEYPDGYKKVSMSLTQALNIALDLLDKEPEHIYKMKFNALRTAMKNHGFTDFYEHVMRESIDFKEPY